MEEAQTTAPNSATAETSQEAQSSPQPGQSPAQASLPEGMDPAAFNAALKQITGLDDYTKLPGQLNASAQLQVKYDEALRQAEAYKAKAELSPFANPMVEQINRYFKENRSPEEARRFLELHALDISSLSGEAAYRHMVRMQNPSYTPEMVDRVIEKEFGPIPADADADAALKTKQRELDIAIAGTKAKAWLSEQTASLEDPKLKEQQARQQEEAARFSRAWGAVAGSLAEAESELLFKINDQKAGGEYFFGYKPKVDAETAKELKGLVAQYAIEKQLPLTQESEAELKNYKEALLWNLYREDFLKHMALDMYASMQKRLMEAQTGAFPAAGGSGRDGQGTGKTTDNGLPRPVATPGNRFF